MYLTLWTVWIDLCKVLVLECLIALQKSCLATKKLILWESYVNRDEYDMFTELKNCTSVNKVDAQESITGHIELLIKKFEGCYGDTWHSDTYKRKILVDLFAVTYLPGEPLHAAEEFLDTMAETANPITFASFKENYPNVSANMNFGVSMYSAYPTVSKYVIQRLIPFAATWHCESGFSAMSGLKAKYFNRMGVDAVISNVCRQYARVWFIETCLWITFYCRLFASHDLMFVLQKIMYTYLLAQVLCTFGSWGLTEGDIFKLGSLQKTFRKHCSMLCVDGTFARSVSQPFTLRGINGFWMKRT